MIDGIRLREQVAQTAGEALIAISQEELDALCQAILDARRIFVAGWGRAGNVIRLLSMNCSQMGLKTHIVGDNSTPSIHEGDLLVIGSGSGNTDTMKILADQPKEHGAKLHWSLPAAAPISSRRPTSPCTFPSSTAARISITSRSH